MQLLEGIFINPLKPKDQRKMSLFYPNPKKRNALEYLNPAKKRKRRKTRKAAPKRQQNALFYPNPPPASRKRRRRKANPANPPAMYAKRRRRRKANPEGDEFTFSLKKDFLKTAAAVVGGFMLPGLIWAMIGANNRAKLAGWFGVGQNNPEKARATIGLITSALWYWLGGKLIPSMKAPILMGTVARTAKDLADAVLSKQVGSTGGTFRMIFSLPAIGNEEFQAVPGAYPPGYQYPGQPAIPGQAPAQGVQLVYNPATGQMEYQPVYAGAGAQAGQPYYNPQTGQYAYPGQPGYPGVQAGQPYYNPQTGQYVYPGQPGYPGVQAGYDPTTGQLIQAGGALAGQIFNALTGQYEPAGGNGGMMPGSQQAGGMFPEDGSGMFPEDGSGGQMPGSLPGETPGSQQAGKEEPQEMPSDMFGIGEVYVDRRRGTPGIGEAYVDRQNRPDRGYHGIGDLWVDRQHAFVEAGQRFPARIR